MRRSTIIKSPSSGIKETIESFVYFHYHRHSRPIVLITSGGTAVDLEENVVRTLENFSTGRRGAISVEQFLKRGYAVIHLWREGSSSPYARVFQDLTGNSFTVDSIDQWICPSSPDVAAAGLGHRNEADMEKIRTEQQLMEYLGSTGQRTVTLSPRLASDFHVRTALRERENALQSNLLLTVPFRTVEQYLQNLQLCATALVPCGRMACVYLAAAVSDFYIPQEERSLHKIQSGSSNGLTLQLEGGIYAFLNDHFAVVTGLHYIYDKLFISQGNAPSQNTIAVSIGFAGFVF